MARARRPGRTIAELRQQCQVLRAALGEQARVSDQELRAYWPGGTENPYPGKEGWYYCWGQYLGMWRASFGSSVVGDAGAVDAALARRLAAEPAEVTLERGRVVHVHPKGYHALRYLDFLDAGFRGVVQAAWQATQDGPTPEALNVLQLYPLMESLAVRLWVWILTHEGPELPFNENDPTPVLPDWLQDVTALDLIRLYRAHRQVNHEEVDLIAKFFPSDPRESRLTLAGFLGTYAGEAKQRPRDVFRRWSLGEVFAQAVTAAEAAREAREQAEREAEARRAERGR